MKILIAGGRGFIGSKIAEKLCQDHRVTVMDSQEDYGVLSRDELRKLYQWRERNWKNVSFIPGDVRKKNDCLKAFSTRPDVVIHLATWPRAKVVNDDPAVGVPLIIDGTVNMLWHCVNFRVKKFIYISSSMVYGDFVDGTKEDANTKPMNLYGEAKLAGERLTKLISKKDGLKYIIIRPSGVYGPGDLPDRVVPKFFKKAMANEPITLHNGDNKVDFTYRQDAAYGIAKAALSDQTNISLNMTAGNAASSRTLAETIIDITGSKSELRDVGMHKLYPQRGTLDISRARELIGYNPEFSLRQGLESYYDWIRQHTGKI